MLDLVQAIVGFLTTWLLIVALPVLGVAICNRLFPDYIIVRRSVGVIGTIVGFALVGNIPGPHPPREAGWVVEYKFAFDYYSKTFSGISQAIVMLAGVYHLVKKWHAAILRSHNSDA